MRISILRVLKIKILILKIVAIKILIPISTLLTISTDMRAEMFDSPISYFDEDKSEGKKQKIEKEAKKESGKDTDKKSRKFNWNLYLNEDNDEFFKEGNYIPPAPFMEAMRKPTRRNILFFEEWKNKRNRLLSRYNKERNRILGLKGRKVGIKTNNEEVYNGLRKYRIIFYFSATCSACKRMFNVMNRLVDNGVYVEAVRVDKVNSTVTGLKIPWSPLSVKEYSLIKKSRVPLLMIFDDELQKAFKIVGAKSAKEILAIIQQSTRP